MLCPKCGSDQNYVKETKRGLNTIERRRLCAICNENFYSVESVVSGRSDCPELMKANNKLIGLNAKRDERRAENRRKRQMKNDSQ